MKIPVLPFTVTDWAGIPPTVHPGETGQAIWRTFTIGDLRVRLVEYSAGYLADHWCDLGHVLYVIEGQLDTELRDGLPAAAPRRARMRSAMASKVCFLATSTIRWRGHESRVRVDLSRPIGAGGMTAVLAIGAV